MLDKLTYAGREENLARPRATPASLRARRDRGPATRSPTRSTRRRRDRQLRRRDARRPLDRRARRVRAHARARHLRAAGGRARARRCATCRSRPTRSTARSRRARSPRSRPLRALLALLGDEGRRRPARRRATSTPTGCETRDLPRLEQLRALPVPREADPADGPQRAARRPAAGLRRRHAGAQLDLRRGLRPRRSATCSSTARRARSTTSAAPTRRRTSRSSSGSSS